MQLIEMLPRYYQKSPPVAELERVLGLQTGALRVSELDTLDARACVCHNPAPSMFSSNAMSFRSSASVSLSSASSGWAL